MEAEGALIFCCLKCNKRLCDDTVLYEINKNGDAVLSGIGENVQKIKLQKKIILACSCGERIGRVIGTYSEQQYCFESSKISSYRVQNSEVNKENNHPREDFDADMVLHSPNPTVASSSHNAVTQKKEWTDLKNEVTELKNTIAAMKATETENAQKMKEMCGMLILQKVDILRLQEVIWALHPNVNLASIFNEGLQIPDLNASIGIDADED